MRVGVVVTHVGGGVGRVYALQKGEEGDSMEGINTCWHKVGWGVGGGGQHLLTQVGAYGGVPGEICAGCCKHTQEC